MSVCHTSEPCNNCWTNWDAIWVEDSGGPREHILDGDWGSRCPMGSGNFEGGKGHPIVKHKDTLPWSVQKWLNWSICCLDCGLGCPKEAQVQLYSPGGASVPSCQGTLAPPGEYDWIVCLRQWCGPYVKLLWPLVNICSHLIVLPFGTVQCWYQQLLKSVADSCYAFSSFMWAWFVDIRRYRILKLHSKV